MCSDIPFCKMVSSFAPHNAKAFTSVYDVFWRYWMVNSVCRLYETRCTVHGQLESMMCASSEKQGLGHCIHKSPLFQVSRDCWDDLKEMSVVGGAILKRHEKKKVEVLEERLLDVPEEE